MIVNYSELSVLIEKMNEETKIECHPLMTKILNKYDGHRDEIMPFLSAENSFSFIDKEGRNIFYLLVDLRK